MNVTEQLSALPAVEQAHVARALMKQAERAAEREVIAAVRDVAPAARQVKLNFFAPLTGGQPARWQVELLDGYWFDEAFELIASLNAQLAGTGTLDLMMQPYVREAAGQFDGFRVVFSADGDTVAGDGQPYEVNPGAVYYD